MEHELLRSANSKAPSAAWPRIAVFSGNYNGVVDGVALTTNKQVAYLESRSLSVKVFAPIRAKPAFPHIGKLVPVPSVPLLTTPYRVALGLTPLVRQELAEFRPDLIHLVSPDLLGFAALEWARRRRVPIVATFHTHFNSYLSYYRIGFLDGLVWRLLRYFYNQADEVYVACESMAKTLEVHGIAKNVRIEPFGVDQHKFSPQQRSEEWRAARGMAPDDVVIGFVGRLVWEKSLRLWANVVRRLEAEGVRHKSLIVGEGPACAELRAMLPNTIFTGRLIEQELTHAFAGMDVFFFPSDSETFGCVTVEALASGLACVVADANGSRDIIRQGREGYVCPAQNEEAFYHAVKELIQQPERRKQFQIQARERAQWYSWERVLERMLANFCRVAGTARQVAGSRRSGLRE